MGTVHLAVAARTRPSVNFIVGGALSAIGVLLWLPQLATLVTKRWMGSIRPWMHYPSWTLGILMGSVAIIIAGACLALAAALVQDQTAISVARRGRSSASRGRTGRQPL